MKNYPTIKLENVISHKEAHACGYTSNHGDCDHWLAKFVHDMDWFRALVKSGGVIQTTYKVTGTKTVPKDKLPETQGQLKALEFSVTTETV